MLTKSQQELVTRIEKLERLAELTRELRADDMIGHLSFKKYESIRNEIDNLLEELKADKVKE